jgi:nucleoside-diphosphate-sugar epimerase
MPRDRIVITGPGGRVGPHLCPLLREKYALRLVDQRPIPVQGDDEFVQADIRDTDGMIAACRGVKALIHLAAISDEDDFRSKLLPINVEGAYSVFEAARLAGVPRVVFTSTAQAVLSYGQGNWVTPEMPVRPWTRYACTKIFGEALARYYVDHHGMAIICIRLAWFQNYDSALLHGPEALPAEWCSPRDFAQLIIRSIESDVRFGIFFGVSNNTGRYWDIANARELLGYEPQDNAAEVIRSGRTAGTSQSASTAPH